MVHFIESGLCHIQPLGHHGILPLNPINLAPPDRHVHRPDALDSVLLLARQLEGAAAGAGKVGAAANGFLIGRLVKIQLLLLGRFLNMG